MPTIQGLLTDCQQALQEISDSPLLDCQILLCHVLDKPQTYLMTWPDLVLTSQQTHQFYSLYKRRMQGEPIAYIVGEREFWSLPLKVAPSTLIPRPDTETLVERVLAGEHVQDANVLDLGTGTGAIALALASEKPNWKITAVDFNHEAVELAKSNQQALALGNVTVIHSDWFSSIENDVKFDLIVSNPPYIDEDDVHLSQGDVRFEPKSALVAPNQGLADIEHIADTARNYLVDGGKVFIEHGYDQGDAVRAIFHELGYDEARTEKDLASNDRVTWAIFNDKKKTNNN
ncbi:peptide chain release factor N(5)-glutamine methyltransferase [Thalassotalea euphylliae]|uniref:peptide chain release factor N(5)-glutamine methyltransferase n=1 Tax=Thalassotalea euphylliae TaxID=1655234 RepID=UPI003640B022